MNENPSLPPLPQPEKKQPWLLRNKWGTFGFALLLLIPLLLFVLPDVMFLVWIVASIMCVVGLFHKPRLLAVLGMLASCRCLLSSFLQQVSTVRPCITRKMKSPTTLWRLTKTN